ncbi:MAG TPA: lyase family protein [Ilumatobacteraceae bacterium]
MSDGLYPGFSTADMDDIFALTARIAAMTAVEAAVATAQAGHGLIPSSAAEAIVAACRQPVSVEVLAQGWDVGTPVLPLLDELRRRVPTDAADCLHRNLTTQDVVDTAAMLLVSEALRHLTELAAQAAAALRDIIHRYGDVTTQARSFLQPADVTTVGFRTARWLDQLDQVRGRLASAETPVQLGGLVGDAMGVPDGVVCAVAAELGLHAHSPWHTDRAPVVALVAVATDFARWAAKIAGDVAQLVQLGEVTTRAGGSSAAAGKRNPIDAMRAAAAAEACLGIATVVTHAKPHELERGLGSWHAEWFAVPLVFQTAGAAVEAATAALWSLVVEPSALVVADDRRSAADAFVVSVLERSP